MPTSTRNVLREQTVGAISDRPQAHNVRPYINVPVSGRFSVYNSLCAAGIAIQLGVDMDTVKTALAGMQTVPGRFELLTKDKPYSVIMDYSHTPDSLKNALVTAREITSGRLICVFGCGGNRDRTKRKLMGEIAAQYADFSIITSDNPRNEDPKQIILDIEEGISAMDGEYIVIENRYSAIEYAIDIVKANDTILLAGKGHETYQEICGKKYDFDEKIITREIIAKHKAQSTKHK